MSAGGDYFDNTVEVMSDKFLHCKIILVLVISKYPEKRYSETAANILFLNIFSPINFIIHSHLQQWLLLCLPNIEFFFLLLLICLLIGAL